MLFASVIFDNKVNFYKTYTYYIPENLQDSVYIGCPVLVQMGNQKTLINSYVIDINNYCQLDKSLLKPIVSINEKCMDAHANAIRLGIWISKHYSYPLNKAINLVLPVKKKISADIKKTVVSLLDDTEVQEKLILEEKKHAKQRIRLLNALLYNKSYDYKYLINTYKLTKGVIDKCIDLKYISILEKTVEKIDFSKLEINKYNTINIDFLNAEQQQAYYTIKNGDSTKPFLLFGITGSGKTEVYIELIKDVLRQEKQIIVLVPEITLTYQLIRRLYKVFGDIIAILNSSLSQGERYEQMQNIVSRKSKIIIGPRSALFAPFDNLGLIIIDEEHDSAYKNDASPNYNIRDVAKKLSKITGAKLLLGSATPELGTYLHALNNTYTLVQLKHRALKTQSLARVKIVDMREELKNHNLGLFSNDLKNLITEKLKKKEQIILFINRRGYSTFVSCRSCGQVIKCPHCDVSLTLHKNSILRCHYCGYFTKKVNSCPYCNSLYINNFGIGTQKVEDYTKKLFPQARILRLDSDNISKKNSSDIIIQKFINREADILIGTQMVVSGHDFLNVTLVGAIMADTSLFYNTYDSAEKTFQMLTQVAGRCGRGDKAGDVIIQTYNPKHHAIKHVLKQDYTSFFSEEITFRKLAKYPPIIRLMCIKLASKSETKLDFVSEKAYEKLYSINSQNNYNATIIGPVLDNIYKVNDYYKKKIYIKHSEYDILLKIKKEFDDSINVNILKYISFSYLFS